MMQPRRNSSQAAAWAQVEVPEAEAEVSSGEWPVEVTDDTTSGAGEALWNPSAPVDIAVDTPVDMPADRLGDQPGDEEDADHAAAARHAAAINQASPFSVPNTFALTPPPATPSAEPWQLASAQDAMPAPCPATQALPLPLPPPRPVALPQPPPSTSTRPSLWVKPQETSPADLRPLLEYAGAGAYLGVGSERTWIALGLQPFSSAWLVDTDAEVVYYNHVNAALLQASGGRRAAYVHLRLHADAEAWDNAEHPLLDAQSHAWWQYAHSDTPWPLHDQHAWGGDFADANYLFNDEQFARIYTLVRAAKVHISRADVFDVATLESLRQSMTDWLSVLDISNCWWQRHAHHRLQPALQALQAHMQDTTLLVCSHQRPSFVERNYWGYFGAHVLPALQAWPEFAAWLQVAEVSGQFILGSRDELTMPCFGTMDAWTQPVDSFDEAEPVMQAAAE